MPHPPKPPDVERSPRSKKLKGEDDPRAILGRLDALMHRPPTPDYQKEYDLQINAERNDRGAVLLIGANLENCLEGAIKKFCEYDRTPKLFGADRPLATFQNKIILGFALGLFGKDTFGNLEVARKIRNVFAHAKIPVSFETAEIKKALGPIELKSLIEWHYGGPVEAGRALEGLERFKHACHWLSTCLIKTYVVGGAVELSPGALKVRLPKGLGRIVALPVPLP